MPFRQLFTLKPDKSHFVRISFALGAKSAGIRPRVTHSGMGIL